MPGGWSGSDCPARHRPARVPAARRVSMAGELAPLFHDGCAMFKRKIPNNFVFFCVKLSFKASPYVKHCKGSDSKLMECLIKALHHLNILNNLKPNGEVKKLPANNRIHSIDISIDT
ncbi:unnamed protein product [Nesidiocoris tenuis]|uniref:Uncharacterized protein n=1 Tax=Nesidiocoris tenuis TaxID=355587 RepID=A0A6H5GWV2_9HEMI|nr:unnamed protein product [Nesidiocoris tenuis]